MTHPREHGLPEYPGGPPLQVIAERTRYISGDKLVAYAAFRLVAKLAAGLRACTDKSEERFLADLGRELDPIEYHVLRESMRSAGRRKSARA